MYGTADPTPTCVVIGVMEQLILLYVWGAVQGQIHTGDHVPCHTAVQKQLRVNIKVLIRLKVQAAGITAGGKIKRSLGCYRVETTGNTFLNLRSRLFPSPTPPLPSDSPLPQHPQVL